MSTLEVPPAGLRRRHPAGPQGEDSVDRATAPSSSAAQSDRSAEDSQDDEGSAPSIRGQLDCCFYVAVLFAVLLVLAYEYKINILTQLQEALPSEADMLRRALGRLQGMLGYFGGADSSGGGRQGDAP